MEPRPQFAVPDQALVEQVCAGDVEAFEALYDRYAREVYVLAGHALGRADAEEVVQEVFLRLWQNARQFDPARGSFAAWFMTIARYRVVDELKRRRNGFAVVGAIEDLLAHAEASTADPEEEALIGERRRAVLDALRALPAEQRFALLLAYFGGLSQSTVAEQLGLPLGTVKKRLRLGLQKLRASLEARSAVETKERPAASRIAR